MQTHFVSTNFSTGTLTSRTIRVRNPTCGSGPEVSAFRNSGRGLNRFTACEVGLPECGFCASPAFPTASNPYRALYDGKQTHTANLTLDSPVPCTGMVKRVLRATWVLAANAGVAGLMFMRLRSIGFPTGTLVDFQLYFEFVFEVLFPAIGIVLELVNWQFARWVNVGCFVIAGGFWLAAAVYWRSDAYFGVLLIIALGLLAIAGLTEIVYRRTRTNPSYMT